jgi:anti-anti-sigma factor
VGVRGGPDGPVVSLAGDLDVTTVSLFKDATREIFEPDTGTELVVDVAELAFCDSVGLSALARLRQECDRVGWTLRVRNVQPYVRRVLVVSGLTEYLNAD